jgi:hypothetical protein
MKFITTLLLFFTSTFAVINLNSQTNLSINIVTANLGIVSQNSIINLNVQVTNTGANPAGVNKISTVISVPSNIALIVGDVQQTGLPAGWIINSNDGETIDICNGSDNIPGGVSRNFVVKIQGTTVGGPSTISGALDFTNGVCGNVGFTLAGDNQSDNSSTTTMTVTVTTPLSLLDFNASVNNCKSALNWSTTNETNTFQFEVEKKSNNSNNWEKIGTVNAQGNSSVQTNYFFLDQNTTLQNKVLYRLKMVDLNGSYKYSLIVPVIGNCKTIKVIIFPNPITNDKIKFSINGFENSALVTLKNVNGQILITKKVTNGTDFLEVSKIANGVYTLQIIDKNNNNSNVKVIIQK